MNSKRAGEPGSDDENEQPSPRPHHATYNNYHIEHAYNANFGENRGVVMQGIHDQAHRAPPVPRPPIDLTAVLNPILDASHTRNLKLSPPNSKCFPKTRETVIGMVLSWGRSDLGEDVPHILWIYGYAGCGKSAISQAVAEQLALEDRLGASFFFFRGSGDRSGIFRFVNTLAHQIALARPNAAAVIEEVVRADHGVRSLSTSSLFVQFRRLVLEPITAIKASLCHGPVIVVLDGVDECEDKEEIAALIEHLIAFFDEDPHFPLRFVIASRVEEHLHRELHASSQVRLLDLVSHTSDKDIETALDVSTAKEMRGRAMPGHGSWPGKQDKQRLVKHIGGSYIFMTTIVKLLFAPSKQDGLTPMDRFTKVLEMKPDFDDLYREILHPCKHFPFFFEILATIALAFQPLSIAQIAELLNIETFKVTNVLINLHAIMQVPRDDLGPVTLWHTSLRDFLRTKERSGCLFADPRNHLLIASGAIHAATSPQSHVRSYSQSFSVEHLVYFVEAARDDKDPLGGEGNTVNLLLVRFGEGQPPLEVACRARKWELVRALVDAGANVDTQFQGSEGGIRVILHAACHYGAKEMVYFLLDKGADPDILAFSSPGWFGNWGRYAFPLAWAAAEADVDLANRLLACAADPNLKGGMYGSALHACAWEGKAEVAHLLLEHGADANIQDQGGWTPLHHASLRGHVGVVKCLLEFKINPNMKENDGWTPLHLACANSHFGVADYLLDHNADPNIRNNGGRTALQLAQSYNMQDAVDMLTRRGIRESRVLRHSNR